MTVSLHLNFCLQTAFELETEVVIKAMMDAEDTRIARAFEMKELQGYSVREIAKELEISQPRVYQLIARAETIGMEYRKING